MSYTVGRFRKELKEAFSKAAEGEEVLIVRRGAIFALISVELALKNRPLRELNRTPDRLKDSPLPEEAPRLNN